jgi:hypothetical protein
MERMDHTGRSLFTADVGGEGGSARPCRLGDINRIGAASQIVGGEAEQDCFPPSLSAVARLIAGKAGPSRPPGIEPGGRPSRQIRSPA